MVPKKKKPDQEETQETPAETLIDDTQQKTQETEITMVVDSQAGTPVEEDVSQVPTEIDEGNDVSTGFNPRKLQVYLALSRTNR